jgi:hypothetical protein
LYFRNAMIPTPGRRAGRVVWAEAAIVRSNTIGNVPMPSKRAGDHRVVPGSFLYGNESLRALTME